MIAAGPGAGIGRTLDSFRQELTAPGLTSRVRRVAYELQRCGDEVLVIEGAQP